MICEPSDVGAEMNVTLSKIPDLTENKVSNNMDLLKKQINFLKEECKNPIITSYWNNVFTQPLPNHKTLTIPISLQKLYLIIVMSTRKKQLKHLN